MKYHQLLLTARLLVGCLAPVGAVGQTSSLVGVGADGRLTYSADSKGNRVPDFSAVGYMNSDAAIPVVPVVKTVAPVSGDDTATVQAAIDQVAAMPLQADGFRGAILFQAGTYQLGSTVYVRSSGIVLRGVGPTTIFNATGTVQYDLIQVVGAAGKTDNTATQSQIMDAFVPIGAMSVTVQSGHTFAVGDWVHLRREPNAAWISLLGMDQLSAIDPAATNWTASGYKISYERQVQAVSGNVIILDAPVMDVIDPAYATGFLVKFTSSRIRQCGIEDLKMTSNYASETDENHGWRAVYLDKVEHAWVRNVTAYYFGYSAVHIASGAAFVTVDGCSMLDPKSIITGGRRYSFNVDGQRNLVQNCTARNGRHDYVNGSRVAGPNVFYNSTATLQHSDIGPHHRWSTGILFDNVTGDGEINVQNRLASGSGHGWAGSQIMLWNCSADSYILHDPPSYHRNWAIGCIGPITNVGVWTTEPLGVVESAGTKIAAIPSLFAEQLTDRLLAIEAENLTRTVSGATASISAEANASGGALVFFNADGANDYIEFTLPSVAAGTYQIRLYYKSHPNRGQHMLRANGTQIGGTLDQYAGTTAYTSFVFGNATFTASGNQTIRLTVTGKNASAGAFTITADAIAVTPVSGAKLSIPGANVIASADDGNVAANTVDGNLATRWSASGDGQWIRYDLGSTKTVTLVKIAFYVGNTRTSTFDVQTSPDATTWTTRTSRTSSGTTTALETFDFTDVSARYVRILGHGNSANLWNSYTEVEVWGF